MKSVVCIDTDIRLSEQKRIFTPLGVRCHTLTVCLECYGIPLNYVVPINFIGMSAIQIWFTSQYHLQTSVVMIKVAASIFSPIVIIMYFIYVFAMCDNKVWL